MAEPLKDINIMELLLKISNDVSSIKTDMTNFKESQRLEKENTSKEIADVRTDFERDLEDLETRVMGKVQTLQTIQNTLVGNVDTLKHAEEKKDARRWRTIVAFIGTAIGGMFVGKIPDIISAICLVLASKG